ncbi:MAG TPA: DDE-type integrase/transposase/recombinase, partial [Verrucomicrobiae bacterium]|nr:DDE-type integrase/transposase/recombinase [Verrucomicrobiae bacterium]
MIPSTETNCCWHTCRSDLRRKLAVILDAFSRKVVGWELDRTLAARLPIAALEKAIAERKPPSGVVHHSDRGVQYA